MISKADAAQVQSLILRTPSGPAVAHLVLSIPNWEDAGRVARFVLGRYNEAYSFGVRSEDAPFCSIGFSFAGLERMKVHDGYLRIFRRLAAAYAAGANMRASQRGDGFANRATEPWPELAHERAHVVVSWHGDESTVQRLAKELTDAWVAAFQNLRDRNVGSASPEFSRLETAQARSGLRLGKPAGQTGQWLHFGVREGLSEVCVDDMSPRPTAPDPRPFAPGALLLGHVNHNHYNVFALPSAPDNVRAFFRNSSFGVLRPMSQDVHAFESALKGWAIQLSAGLEHVTTDFVKAKLCGRWPNGQVLQPGEWIQPSSGSLVLNLTADRDGQGCPFGAHVRRMRAPADGHGRVLERPLQRRGMPYGPAADPSKKDNTPRGLLGHFFCASIEDQFEHLLGQWAAQPPLGFGANDQASDPLLGPHGDTLATLNLPLKDNPPQQLSGWQPWVRPLGTMYAWYPSRVALETIFNSMYSTDDEETPWV